MGYLVSARLHRLVYKTGKTKVYTQDGHEGLTRGCGQPGRHVITHAQQTPVRLTGAWPKAWNGQATSENGDF